MRTNRLLCLATLLCSACFGSEVRRVPPELAGLRVWVDPAVAVSGPGAAAATESRSSRTQELADLGQFSLQQLPEPGVQNAVDRDLYRAVQGALSDAGFRLVDDAASSDFTARLFVEMKSYNTIDGTVGRASLELRERQSHASAAYIDADVNAHTRSTSAWASQAATLLVNRAGQVQHLLDVARRIKSLRQ